MIRISELIPWHALAGALLITALFVLPLYLAATTPESDVSAAAPDLPPGMPWAALLRSLSVWSGFGSMVKAFS